MPDIQKTIEIIFGAVDNTGSGISSVGQKINSVVDAASNVTEPLSRVADYAVAAEAAVLAMGAAFLTIAVNEASTFGEKVEEIGSLVNASPAQYDALKVAIQEFASDSTSNFDQIGNAVYIATSNLGDTAQAMDVLKVAEEGAIVGATNLESATSLLTRTMNAYGLASDDSGTNTQNAERVMAAMFVTVQNGDTTMQALADNMGKVASTAAAANVPIETVGAAIAALTGAGISTDQSMTLLNSVLKELLDPSKELSAALGGMSVAADGLPAVMDRLQSATGGSADKFYELFSSTEAAKGAIVLANDSAGKFDGTLEAMSTSVQTFKTNFENMAGGVEDSTQKLENNVKILLQKVGDPLQDGWADILDGLSAVMQGFSLSVEEGAFAPVFTAFDGFADDIADTLRTIAENLPEALSQVDFTQLLDALSDVGLEIGDLFGDIDLSTPEGLASAIQFVVDSFESLTRVVSGVIDAWGPVVQGLLSGVDAFNNLDDSTKKTIGNVTGLAQVFESLKGFVTGGAGALETIGNALSVIAGSNAANAVGALASALGAAEFTAGGLALAAIGFAIKENMEAYQDYKQTQDTISESSAHLAETQGKLAERLTEISQHTGVTVNSMDDLNKAVEDGRLVFNEATGAYEAAGAGIRDYDAEVAAASSGGADFSDAVNEVAKSLGLSADAADQAAKGFNTIEEAQRYAAEAFADSNNVVISYKDGLYQVSDGVFGVAEAQDSLEQSNNKTKDSFGKLTEEEKLAIENTQKIQETLLKLASDERISAMKFSVELETARIDAQVEQVKAALGTLSDFYDSNADILSSLTEGIIDPNATPQDKEFFKEQFNRQMDLQERMIQSNIDLNTSITELNYAYAQSLLQETTVRIESDGLDHNIEAFMFEVLKRIQTKVVGDRSAFLLGSVA